MSQLNNSLGLGHHVNLAHTEGAALQYVAHTHVIHPPLPVIPPCVRQGPHAQFSLFYVINLLGLNLLDMGRHLGILPLYISKQLITLDICIMTFLQLEEKVIQGSPETGVIILLTRLLSEGGTCKMVRIIWCGVCR